MTNIGKIVQRTELDAPASLPLTHAVEQFGAGMHVELLVNVPLVSKRSPLGNAKLFLNAGNVVAVRKHGKHITFAWRKTARICKKSAVTGQSVYFIGHIISRNNGIARSALFHIRCPISPIVAKT